MPRDSITHDGVHEWRAYHVDPNGETTDGILQAAYDAGHAIGMYEAEAALSALTATTTTPRPKGKYRSIDDDWEPTRDA